MSLALSRPELHTEFRIVLSLLLISGLLAALSPLRRFLLPGVALTLTSLAWLKVDQYREGRILLVISPAHGVCESDLLVPLVVGVVAVTRALRFVIHNSLRGDGRHLDVGP